MTAPDTKQRILDVAEQQFAEHGYAGASLRGIIAAAEVNLAAVHYHFRSKEALLEAVLLRRSEPLNLERLRLLDTYESLAGRKGATLEDILDAFIGPPMRLVLSPNGEGRIFGKLVGRLHAESGEQFFLLMKKHFAAVSLRFGAALQRALPDLPKADLYWRLHWAAGAMSHTLVHWDQLESMSGGLLKTKDVSVIIPNLAAFLAAGFRAASPGKPAAARKGKRS